MIIKIILCYNKDIVEKVGETMKEAAGEANMTVITIVLIAIVLAVGTVIVTNMMNSTREKTNCTNDGGCMVSGQCQIPCPTNQ